MFFVIFLEAFFAFLMQLGGASAPPTPPAAVGTPVTLARVTAYCATGFNNAAGHLPRAGEAAGNRWPLGTRIAVPGYGTVVIEDRIGYGSDLDLYFGARPDCEAAAEAWGAKTMTVRVLP